jgi:TusA-related sulfurtransferase
VELNEMKKAVTLSVKKYGKLKSGDTIEIGGEKHKVIKTFPKTEERTDGEYQFVDVETITESKYPNTFADYLKEKPSVKLKQYIVKIKHDNGVVSIRTGASSEEAAKKQVTNAEGAPMSAIISVEEVK